jgi:hypothetical protein
MLGLETISQRHPEAIAEGSCSYCAVRLSRSGQCESVEFFERLD